MDQPSYVLIVDGGNYCSTQEMVTSAQLRQGDFVDAVKVVGELERIVGCKFTTKFYFQGTQSKRPNEFHRALAQPPPHGPHFNVEIFGKKRQWGMNANNSRSEIFVEEGVDVAVATKIIECAYGIGKEEQSDKIVVITGDGDMLKAIECADAKRRNTVRVVSARQSLSASLNSYVLIDPETSNAVFLDELMIRCTSRRNGNASSNENTDLIPTGQMPENYFHQGSNNFNRGDGNNNRRGGGGRNYQQKPPKESRSNRFDRNRDQGGALSGNEILRTDGVAALIDRSSAAVAHDGSDLDMQGFKTVSKLKRKLRKHVSDGRDQLSDIDEDDQYDHPNNYKLQHTTPFDASGATAAALGAPGVHSMNYSAGSSNSNRGAVGGYVPKATVASGGNSGLIALPDIDMDSESDTNYNTDASDAIVLTGMGHLSKSQRKKLRRRMKKEKQARALAEAAAGAGAITALGMRPIGAKEGERVTVDLVDDDEGGGLTGLNIHGVNAVGRGGSYGRRGDVISID